MYTRKRTAQPSKQQLLVTGVKEHPSSSPSSSSLPLSYRENVLGKHVIIDFWDESTRTLVPYLGQIQEMKVTLQTDGMLQWEHFVVFEDGDQLWFDLKQEEEEGHLMWTKDCISNSRPACCVLQHNTGNTKRQRTTAAVQEEDEDVDISSVRSTVTAVSLVGSSDSHPHLLDDPVQMGCDSVVKETSCLAQSYNKLQQQLVDSRVNNRYGHGQTIALTQDRLNGMYRWMTEIPNGTRNQPMSPEQANLIMQKVRALANGEGISHARSGLNGVAFYKNLKVDLSFDFDEMWQRAKEFELKHGKDISGDHSLLFQPVAKLRQYKEFLLSGSLVSKFVHEKRKQ